MELWHFDFLEIGPKTRKSAKNRQKLDLSILVFIYFCPALLEEIRSNFLIPELRNRPRWGKKKTVQNRPPQHGENNSSNLAQAIFQPNLAQCTLGQEYDRVLGS